jgi:hypothetical protein
VLTTTLGTRELEFLISRIDEYIEVMEFMILKMPALRTRVGPKAQEEAEPRQRDPKSAAEEHCEQAPLAGASLVSMMKSAHLRNFYDKAVLRPVDCSGLRRIFGQG